MGPPPPLLYQPPPPAPQLLPPHPSQFPIKAVGPRGCRRCCCGAETEGGERVGRAQGDCGMAVGSVGYTEGLWGAQGGCGMAVGSVEYTGGRRVGCGWHTGAVGHMGSLWSLWGAQGVCGVHGKAGGSMEVAGAYRAPRDSVGLGVVCGAQRGSMGWGHPLLGGSREGTQGGFEVYGGGTGVLWVGGVYGGGTGRLWGLWGHGGFMGHTRGLWGGSGICGVQPLTPHVPPRSLHPTLRTYRLQVRAVLGGLGVGNGCGGLYPPGDSVPMGLVALGAPSLAMGLHQGAVPGGLSPSPSPPGDILPMGQMVDVVSPELWDGPGTP